MGSEIRKRLRKKDIFTIPNLLSVVRILLIPIIIILYVKHKNYIGAVVVVIVSGLTDVVDGAIARKYNMISDFGKFLDPVADKLTQVSIIVCLMLQHTGMIALLIIMFLKESFLFILGCITLKRTDTINSAKWYGKATTIILYLIMVILFLFPNINSTVANILIGVCIFVVVGSLCLYTRFYYIILSQDSKSFKCKSEK